MFRSVPRPSTSCSSAIRPQSMQEADSARGPPGNDIDGDSGVLFVACRCMLIEMRVGAS